MFVICAGFGNQIVFLYQRLEAIRLKILKKSTIN